MAKQPGFWNVEDRLKEISADGDPLEALDRTVDFERFRPALVPPRAIRDIARVRRTIGIRGSRLA